MSYFQCFTTAKVISYCAALLLVAAPTATIAHSGDKHAKPAARKPISTEETAFGREGDPKRVARTIQIDMSDAMRFSPASITVKQGETVRFVVRNVGKVLHEMVIGTMTELKAHGELMKKHPNMEHDEPYMSHVDPGKRAEMVWQFTKAGEFYFACLLPGHLDAGMIGKITVTQR